MKNFFTSLEQGWTFNKQSPAFTACANRRLMFQLHAKYDGAQGYTKKALWIGKKIGDGEQEARIYQ